VDAARPAEAARCDGIFPLISDKMAMSAKELLLAYQEQPMIEMRRAYETGPHSVGRRAFRHLWDVGRIDVIRASTLS
jgi:hypothetical protein